jgi:hypothetical protein
MHMPGDLLLLLLLSMQDHSLVVDCSVYVKLERKHVYAAYVEEEIHRELGEGSNHKIVGGQCRP